MSTTLYIEEEFLEVFANRHDKTSSCFALRHVTRVAIKMSLRTSWYAEHSPPLS